MGKFLIVGGNSGIGLAAGRKLLAQGYELIQWSRDSGELAQAGAKQVDYQIGKGDVDLLQASLPETLDGLIYCPGSVRLKPFHRTPLHEFREDFEINAVGAVEVIQLALSSLRAGDGGAVVLFSSVAAQVGLGFHASIAAAKAAVEGLTVSLAAELAPSIRVNAIAPSLTDTPLVKNLLKSEQQREAASQRHPLQTIGEPEAMADLVHYLLGDTSKFVTGQIFRADGGMSSVRV